MTTKSYTCWRLSALSIAFIVCCAAIYQLSLKTSICTRCRAFLTLLHKPHDYHTPIFDGEFIIKENKSLTIIGTPSYSGRHSIYMNPDDEKVVGVKAVECSLDGSQLEVALESTKISDRVGMGWSVAYFNVDSTLSREELLCVIRVAETKAERIRVRLVKLSEL